MADNDDTDAPACCSATCQRMAPPPKRLRLPLRNISDLQNELARIYRAAKRGDVPVVDASRLANILQILGRLIEGSDLERRLETLENGHVTAPRTYLRA